MQKSNLNEGQFSNISFCYVVSICQAMKFSFLRFAYSIILSYTTEIEAIVLGQFNVLDYYDLQITLCVSFSNTAVSKI